MMKSPICRSRLALSMALMALLITLPSCGGGGGGGSTPPSTITASFTPGSASPGANLVRLIQKSASGDLVTLQVTIGGPTTSSDYYAFAFDILIGDTDVAEFVNTTGLAGDFLTAPITAIVSQSGDRVIAGISKQASVPGNGIADGSEKVVLELTMRAKMVGSSPLTITGYTGTSMPPPGCAAGAAAALDSQNPQNCIGSTIFSAAASTISGS